MVDDLREFNPEGFENGLIELDDSKLTYEKENGNLVRIIFN